jgi:hypothetical protein
LSSFIAATMVRVLPVPGGLEEEQKLVSQDV